MCAADDITKQRAHNLFHLQHQEAVTFITALISNYFQYPRLFKSEKNSEGFKDNYRGYNKKKPKPCKRCLHGINTQK